ncbi:ATP-binding protein [Sphingomonas sp. IC4-52]|uniref:ATP-binding protein n=1 Tax=Sphingomonas sp. IC4-52 TaxID=2887202 RepID=UPI001D0FAF8D|nr:ATP-binding protein [Sphingomonas sp. IC4-52]MCC2981224.1 ATP-binding protein [Sphingomonas sp. IC4-52]
MSAGFSVPQAPLSAALRFAALSGPFHPADALRVATDSAAAGTGSPSPATDPVAMSLLATALAESCDTSPPDRPGEWLIRTSERARVLREIDADPRADLLDAVRAHAVDGGDRETGDLVAVLLGREPMDLASIERVIAKPSSREELARIAVAIDRAGGLAPLPADLGHAVRSAIAAWDERARRAAFAATPFRGRRREVGDLVAFARSTFPGTVRCAFVTGPPGIGKSALLDRVALDLAAGGDWILLRFDFDRAGLDPSDPVGFTLEAARQVGQQLGRAGGGLLEMRMSATEFVGAAPDVLESSSEIAQSPTGPQPLVDRMAEDVGRAGRKVLVLLDTLEVLRGRGEAQPPTLFYLLDGYAAAFGGMAVLAAGRGDALDSCSERYGQPVDLAGLNPGEAREVLADLDVAEHLREELVALAAGSPLKLRLAAEVARRGDLPLLPRRRRAVDEGFLYRFLLSRIADPLLRRLAHPGLVLRRVDAEVLREVVGPALRIRLSTAEADRAFSELATHHWLMTAGPDGVLRHRPDVRALLLPHIYASAPRQAAAIDEAAVRWYARRSEGWADVEGAYHRLQLMRARPGLPLLPARVLGRLDAEARRELPEEARRLVLEATGDRGDSLRVGGGDLDEEDLIQELRAILQRGDWREAGYVLDRVAQARILAAASPASDLLRAAMWRAGRWAEARLSLIERDRVEPGDGDIVDLSAEAALARLEMRAELDPAAARRMPNLLPERADELGREAIRANDNMARHGALAFVRRDRPLVPFVAAREGDFDLAAAIAPEALQGASAERAAALELGRQRVSRWLGGKVSDARALAALTPYATPIAALALDPSRAAIALHAGAVVSGVLGSRSLALGVVAARPASSVSNPISALSEMGLLAEWAGVAAQDVRDDDLALIARAAERWRRSAAGDWAYPAGPRGGTERPDAELAGRLDALRASPEPLQEALIELAVWSGRPAGSPDDVLTIGRSEARRLRRRWWRALLHATHEDTPRGALAGLLAHRVPSAVAPALAILQHNLIAGDLP